ncbi:MAG TPA: hypothetical protein DEB39_12245, partial [Planctomycetaceae bacterium]|nr:hypothetical protein [Planctomycetaceae bacterium]
MEIVNPVRPLEAKQLRPLRTATEQHTNNIGKMSCSYSVNRPSLACLRNSPNGEGNPKGFPSPRPSSNNRFVEINSENRYDGKKTIYRNEKVALFVLRNLYRRLVKRIFRERLKFPEA